MPSRSRRAIALHEAGHAVADVVLGTPLEYVSIRRGRTFLGVTVPAPREVPEAAKLRIGSAVTQSPEHRAFAERTIVALYAGALAERLGTEPTSGYVEEWSVEEIAEAALRRLEPRLGELLAVHEQRDEPTDNDESRARDIAHAVNDDDGTAEYLGWLRAVARALVLRYQAAILRVADALERYAVLTGEQIAALTYGKEIDIA